MPQKPLTTEVIERAKQLRSEGKTTLEIASELRISQGSVSNITRDIAKPAKSTQLKKEVPSGRREAKDIMEAAAGAKLDSDTIDLANRVRKARLQAELDDVEDRKHQRQEVEDLRIKERKLMLQLDESRLGAAKGDSGVVAEISQLRSELGELREARHQAELRQIEDRHSADMRRMEQLVASTRHAGLTEYDLMSEAMGKFENLFIHASDKVDRLVKSGQGDKQLMLGLQLGLTPSEFQHLQQGEDLIPTREDFEVGRRYRAHRDGVPYEEPEEGEYEGLVSLIEQRNRRWQTVMEKASRAMGRGGSQVVKTGKTPGQVPAPGDPEPVVLKSESKVVKCQRCGTTFDIDLTASKQQAAQGKKLFVECPNPGCKFLLDLTELIPELKPAADKSTTPKCYIAGQDGHCNSELRSTEQCTGCQWTGDSIKPLVYE